MKATKVQESSKRPTDLICRILISQSCLNLPVRNDDIYESVTASRYVKRVQPSLLMRTPQDPSGDVSLTVSLRLVLYFNTLHVRFHVDLLEEHQQHH
jgi:hypothetical protein